MWVTSCFPTYVVMDLTFFQGQASRKPSTGLAPSDWTGDTHVGTQAPGRDKAPQFMVLMLVSMEYKTDVEIVGYRNVC
jgi:hypothetical protein